MGLKIAVKWSILKNIDSIERPEIMFAFLVVARQQWCVASACPSDVSVAAA
jgi:hypothetical protein